MRGFDTKALILLPKIEAYTNRAQVFRYQLEKSVQNVCKYLRTQNIEPHAFYTDDVARELKLADFKFINTLQRGDLFFVQNNCENMSDAMRTEFVEYPDVINDIASKLPITPDMTVDQRFDTILKRDKKVISTLIPTYKIIFNFYRKSVSNYHVAVKQGDGKIRCIIDPNTFMMTTYLGGNIEDPISLFGVPYANRALDLWEVDDVNS